MKLYKREHPDFDNEEIFEQLESKLSEHGFEDLSWHNDTNPSLQLNYDEKEVKVFVSYKNDPDMDALFIIFGYDWDIQEEINLTKTDNIEDAVESAVSIKDIILSDEKKISM
jgi:hypothetical protein